MLTGMFITLEGGEGSGKSTQIRSLRDRLKRRNVPVTMIREPGGTPLGDLMRQMLKFTTIPLTPKAELLLFNASRSQLVTDVIRPALEKGEVVLCDRFTDSTLAYQGYGRGISLAQVEEVNKVATDGLKPDLTVLLDIPPEEGIERQFTANERFEGGFVQQETSNPEQRESQGLLMDIHSDISLKGQPIGREQLEGERGRANILDFHHRVHQGYLALARIEPDRWLTLDARLSPSQVARLIWQRVEPLVKKMEIAKKVP